MSKKVVLISFADSKYSLSLKRLEKEIEQFESITDSYFFTEKDLDAEFKRNFNPFIYRRGYGYWKWKAYLSKRVLDKLASDDILVWSDAGNIFNPKAENKFKYYLDLAIKSESGIFVFQDKFVETKYTKADCFAHFGALDNLDITNTNQIWAGCWIIKKTNKSVDFINKWYNAIIGNFHLITDKQSILPNFPDFIEHRHDQSVFSILSKQYETTIIPCSDLDISSSPIQAKRYKQKRKFDNIQQKLLFPIRYSIGLYLVYLRKFYFKDRIAW